MDLEKTRSSKKIENLHAEQDCDVRCKKYAAQPSRVAVAKGVEDIQRMVQFELKPADMNHVLAGDMLFKEDAYAELLEIADEFGHVHTEAAIKSFLLETKISRTMRRGGIRSWRYFEGVVRDWAAKEDAAKVGIDLEECPW